MKHRYLAASVDGVVETRRGRKIRGGQTVSAAGRQVLVAGPVVDTANAEGPEFPLGPIAPPAPARSLS